MSYNFVVNEGREFPPLPPYIRSCNFRASNERGKIGHHYDRGSHRRWKPFIEQTNRVYQYMSCIFTVNSKSKIYSVNRKLLSVFRKIRSIYDLYVFIGPFIEIVLFVIVKKFDDKRTVRPQNKHVTYFVVLQKKKKLMIHFTIA